MDRLRLVILKARYAMFFMRFKIKMAFKPYIANTPASSTVTRWSLTRHKYGFILIVPGELRKRCSRRIIVSWKFWSDGPCNLATFIWLHWPKERSDA